MLPGSGSLAVDSAAHSAFLPGETVIVGHNGWFGERMQDVLRANGVHVVLLSFDPRTPLDPDAFRQALREHPEATGVACVHLETSTGVLNPVEAIARIVHEESDALLLVDAVTGLGAAELRTDAWGIDLCVSASQKALGAPAGLGLVAVSARAQRRIDARPEAGRSWYLDLGRWRWFAENWADWHPFPVTMPTSVVLALRCALQGLLHEGLDVRQARYREMARLLRDYVVSAGMPLFVPEAHMAPTITAAFCPDGVMAGDIRDDLLRDHGLQITTGFGSYKDSVIRVGHMGGALTTTDMHRLIAGLEQVLAQRVTAG
jgi:alanine-glyoxylate transaminase/serine-glyoxylate transaminase/serine-pyruvate transaminase